MGSHEGNGGIHMVWKVVEVVVRLTLAAAVFFMLWSLVVNV